MVNNSCENHTNLWYDIQYNVYFVVYFIMLPIYFIVGISVNIILFLAFYKKSKTEHAYTYQVILTLAKIWEIFTYGGMIFWFHLGLGFGAPSGIPLVEWVQKSYWFMYIFNHIITPVARGAIVCSLLCSVAMTADRALALSNPFMYKTMNHKRHQLIAGLSCFILGHFSSIEDGWLDWVVPVGEGRYGLVVNDNYLKQPVITALTIIRTVTRFGTLFALIVLSALIILWFRKRARAVAHMAANNEKKEATRKAADKTLLLLNVYQSILMCVNQIPQMWYIAFWNLEIGWFRCHEPMIAPFIDMAIFITDALDFFVIMAINTKVRVMVAKVMPCQK